ncbi:hypothetical protein H206_05365 [Candidatus Electrothrix aarhusensis]|uniref:Uncharacterized protein n=1 Tax=Candidatus Electrothrix aarhusensis TaxID=1859131 RepID=A0A3S3QUH1_9BACT|nr:hypothetical protein H206_05365 [Candidatus Electrothrix aarhusensis]
MVHSQLLNGKFVLTVMADARSGGLLPPTGFA